MSVAVLENAPYSLPTNAKSRPSEPRNAKKTEGRRETGLPDKKREKEDKFRTSRGHVCSKRWSRAPPDCRAYGYKRRQESERRRVINLAVFHVSRRGRTLLMETSFDLHLRPRVHPSNLRVFFSPLSFTKLLLRSSGLLFDKRVACIV